ncbi:hypothetical protein [Nostoc sp. CALU 546]|uniref:hypothetical protein n=1 Tax=Nostoc sp. CALU 546 TaxID=1867241 RepID=UPI003B67BFDA
MSKDSNKAVFIGIKPRSFTQNVPKCICVLWRSLWQVSGGASIIMPIFPLGFTPQLNVSQITLSTA